MLLMHARVFWAVVIGFLSGVLLRSIVLLSWPFAAFLLLLAALAVLLYIVDGTRRKTLIIGAVALAACAGGIIRMSQASLVADPRLVSNLGKSVTLGGVVAEEPDLRDSGTRLHVRVTTLIYQSATTSVIGDVLVLAPPHERIAYGDEIVATGKLRLPEAFDTAAGRTFNYPMYLAKDGILYELAFAHVSPNGEHHGTMAKAGALGVKHALLAGLERALPEPEAGLASGITLGDKRSVGKELTAVFTRASLVHIIVLSGYNITVVINAAVRIFFWLPRLFKFGAGGFVVAFFILMTGGAATAVRAGLMTFLAVYARLARRVFLALRALGAAAFVMILWNPLTLAYDPSFQLSALATLGLVLFTPLVDTHLSWLTTRFSVREIVSSTIATQFAVLPLLLYQSGNLSLVALPANLFALAAIPPAMALSVVAALAGLFAPPLAVIVGLPAYILLWYVIEVATLFSSLPFAALTVPAFSAWLLAAAYFLLGLAYYVAQNKTAPNARAAMRSQ